MKVYRVSVPAQIYLDVPAESEEQAIRLAAAALQTPVEPLEEGILTIWGPDSADETDGILVAVVYSDDERDAESELRSFLAFARTMGNEDDVNNVMGETK